MKVSLMTLCAAAVVSAQIPADQPVERSDQNSHIAHTQLLEKARRGGIDIYFEGDSIVRRWGAADYGWGADTTQNILWRLNNGELDGVHPKVIVLLAGTNNVGTRSRTADEGAVAAD